MELPWKPSGPHEVKLLRLYMVKYRHVADRDVLHRFESRIPSTVMNLIDTFEPYDAKLQRATPETVCGMVRIMS